MKKSLMLIALAVISTAAYAADPAPTPTPAPKAGDKNGHGFMVQLTDAQKQCIDQQNCIKPDFKQGVKPDETQMKTFRDCMVKAFDTCGVKMPEHKAGDKPAFDGKKRGEKPVTPTPTPAPAPVPQPTPAPAAPAAPVAQ